MIKDVGFQSSRERVVNEVEHRRDLAVRMLPFGMHYLNKVLRGILPDDLILLGAASGIGKTELATTIALASAEIGKQVYYFALEAGKDEIERRMKYKILARSYAEDLRSQHLMPQDTNYHDWFLGKYEELFAPYAEQVGNSPAWMNLHTYYRTGEFGIRDFEKITMAIAEKANLIIVDHIHYFDWEGSDENRALADATKKIRDLALINQVPIVLVAHLRKRNEASATLVPSLDDFHGSSNLAKIATKAIILAPGEVIESGRVNTYIWVAKNRIDGSATRYIGECVFNTRTNQYEQRFKAGIRSKDGTKIIPFSEEKEIPSWLR